MAGFKIQIREYRMTGKNGDRAVTESPYSDFKVVLLDCITDNEVELKYFPGYDHVNSHIVGERTKGLYAAQDYANKLSRFFAGVNIQVNTELVIFKRKLVTKTSWERVNDH